MGKIVLSFSLCLLLAFVLFFNWSRSTVFVVYAAGIPDVYGNQIVNCTVSQLDGGWIIKGVVTSSNYSSGVQVRVDADKYTRFNVTLKLNVTFAGNEIQAMANTRCYINITYANGTVVVPDTEMTDWQAVLSGGFYYVYASFTWMESGHPAAGVTYNVYLKYEAYY